MGNKLYVGSLPYSTTEQQLSELFAEHGAVQSAKVITDRYTGQSRGFGFVEMSTGEEAQKAITALNGTPLGGRTLVVVREGLWLTAEVLVIAERIGDDRQRPSLTNTKSFVDEVEEVLRERQPKYAAAADHMIPTDGRSLAQVGEAILTLLGKPESLI